MIFSEKTKMILCVGTPLQEFDVNNWGLTRGQAIDAIEKLKREKVLILGGDVVYIDNGRLIYTYDNWSTDSEFDDNEDIYISKSAIKSVSYIESYYNLKVKGCLFVLIPDEKVVEDAALHQLQSYWKPKG